MQAGAAMAVVGWWSGYKLGGVIALFAAEYLEIIGLIITGKLLFNFRYCSNCLQYRFNVCS